jgi:hypothetical protein
MLPCEEIQELAEEYLNDTLEAERCHAVSTHLQVCAPCHRFVDEARLARRVLEETGAPPPPPRLADRIKHAGLMRLRHRPRPLHERALGSPAFLAVCASLLCGAIICLMAIMKVAAVDPWPEPSPPRVSVVARMVLPVREPGLSVQRAIATLEPPREATRPRLRAARALATVAAPVRPAAAHARMRPVAASGPRRALTPFVHAAPTLSLTPTLPEVMIVPASARISLPEGGTPALHAEPAPVHSLTGTRDAEAPRLEFSDLAAPQPPRADFTTTR